MDFSVIPDYEENMSGLIKIVDKKKIVKLYGRSPDIIDACMLTFAYPVRRMSVQNRKAIANKQQLKRVGKNQSPLSTMNRVRNRNRGRQEGTVYKVSYDN